MTAVAVSSVDPLLREALDQITWRYRGLEVGEQIEEVERLRNQFPHSITVRQRVTDARPGDNQFTCFMHALDLSAPPSLVVNIIKRFDHVYPGAEFIRLLIEHQLLKAISEPEEGAVLIYALDGTPKHAGKFAGDMVVSKWGLGHVWQHHMFEVPASYGDSVDVFGRVDSETAAAWFVEYATAQVGADTIALLKRSDA